jgi:hypothetical protein
VPHQPSNPEDCFGTSLWGFGPWPFDGTDANIQAWAFTNVLLVGGPISATVGTAHPDHDAGLIAPGAPGFHPDPDPALISIDPTNPITQVEWDALTALGILNAWVGPGPTESITATDLNVTWATAQLGVGYPVPVGSCPPHPPGSGYGGVGFGSLALGGTGYGMSSYGARSFPAPPINISGGYGGDPYGFGGYGSADVQPPSLASAVSLDGWEIEVFFDEEMDPTDTELVDPTNYTLTAVLGGASTVSAVRIEKLGAIDYSAGDFIAGVTSVIITHTGTTLGGTYTVAASGMSDVGGNLLTGATVNLMTKGEPPAFTVTPISGNQLVVAFAEDMLLAASYHAGAVETILSEASYGFTSVPAYPVALDITAVEHPYNGNLKEVLLTVNGQTSLSYTTEISPSSVWNYDGTVLPDTLTGVSKVEEAGVAQTGVISGSNWVVSQTGAGKAEWTWLDQTVFLGAASTFRTDLTFNALNTFTKPVGFVALDILKFQVGDGAVEFNVGFGWDGGTNLPILTVSTGPAGFTQSFNIYDWTDGAHTVSMVRNQKASIVVCLWDGVPIFASFLANLTAPVAPWSAGNRLSFTTSAVVPALTGVLIDALVTTASSTVFSGAWNFLHGLLGPAFVGALANTKDWVQVARGPLVKGWGDATPATKQNVVVEVNGTAVAVSDVNPYIGKITTTIPIPLMPIGGIDVAVDYQWMATPVMEFAGLNTEGLVLNKSDCKAGHHDPIGGHGEQIQVLPGVNFLADPGIPKGAPDIHRYPMSVVLGPFLKPEPLYIGHRYMGFQREHSAMLNSPTTMLLNQHPNQSIVEGFEHRPVGESVTYEGLVRPTADTPAWSLEGTDTGGVVTDAEGATGVYRLVDAQTGHYDPDDPQAAFYWRDVDLNFPSTLYVLGRFNVSNDTTLTVDGVFTGVGMGVHDGFHLYLMGCLLVNGVEHVAMLLDANKPARIESWQLGPQAQLSLQSGLTATALATQVPADLKAGDRFQIFHGDGNTTADHTQKGVYTLASVVFQTDGTVTLTTTTAFPAHWNTYGNKYPIATFEVLWATSEVSTTFRLVVDPEQQVATLRSSGSTITAITTLDGGVTQLPQPAETSLLLPSATDVQDGQAFFGSLSREAANESRWTFFRYGVVPDVTSVAGHEVVVEAEMNEVPEQDPNHDWMLLGNFGYSEIDSTADALLLKQTSADEVRDFAFGYARNETWFTPEANFDITGKFRVETGSGVQDAQMVVNDTLREVRLGTLLYGESSFRFLIRTPDVSFKGLREPWEQDGWVKASFPGFTDAVLDFQEACMVVTQGVDQKFAAQGTLLSNSLNFVEGYGRVLEARFAVTAYNAGADSFTGIRLNGGFGNPGVPAGLHLYAGVTPGVRVITNGDNTVQDYTFDWTDGELHTYRMVLDAENAAVLVYFDDTLQTPTLAAAAFSGGATIGACSFGQYSLDSTGTHDATITSTVEWRSSSLQGLPHNAAKRTLGVLRGVAPNQDDINDWELPRTDASTAVNSSLSGPVIEEMDWRSWVEVRLWRDPTWGVTVLRPDLPLPPFYVPEDPNVPGTGFATQMTEPSAGWINVEYAHLPRVTSTFGRVEFGSLRRDNVTQQRWERVRYRLFKSPTDDLRMPQGMVLNRHNVITSGELTADRGHETVIVQTLDDLRVTLLPTHLYAERIWKVIDGANIYTSEMFTFRPESQLITLLPDSSGTPRCFGVRTQGTQGTFAQRSTEFTGPNGDFTNVVKDDLLKIRFGEAAGSYRILRVDAALKKVWVDTPFPADPAGGDEEWSISQIRVPVTVVFVPGKPVTNTYLLNQPLLDGITKLNEGTPPVPMSQTAESTRQETWGSQINDPQDVLNNDPNFVLNDPFRVVTFADDADAHYEQMSFMEVNNGGQEGLISFPCEATALDGISGFDSDAGDAIYDTNGADTGSKVGAPYGGHVLQFSGTSYWEDARRVQPFADTGMLGSILFAAGGTHAGPVDSLAHVNAGHVPALAGTLNSTSLHPLVNMGVRAALITNAGLVIPLDGSEGIPPSFVPVL